MGTFCGGAPPIGVSSAAALEEETIFDLGAIVRLNLWRFFDKKFGALWVLKKLKAFCSNTEFVEEEELK